jgi:hypothetical protein
MGVCCGLEQGLCQFSESPHGAARGKTWAAVFFNGFGKLRNDVLFIQLFEQWENAEEPKDPRAETFVER